MLSLLRVSSLLVFPNPIVISNLLLSPTVLTVLAKFLNESTSVLDLLDSISSLYNDCPKSKLNVTDLTNSAFLTFSIPVLYLIGSILIVIPLLLDIHEFK